MTPTEPSIKSPVAVSSTPASAGATDIPPPPNSRSALPKEYDFFKVVQDYLDRAAKVINLEPYVQTILSQPKNEIIINFPVRMDNGEVRLFKGYRVQHNNLLGPFKGGMRFHPNVTLDDVKALASMMTWKAALMRLPYGGGKGGIKFDPRSVSKDELQRITRRFTHALGGNIGPEYDIPAPDVNTNSQTMAWMMDTYANMVGAFNKQSVKGVVTGKPVASGGTLGRSKATGQGMVHCVTEWAQETGFTLEGSTMIVQGFGNVGSNCAVILSKLGVSTIAVGDHTGYLINPEGFNAHKLQDHVAAKGSIAGYPGGKSITREEFFATKADIFAPSALENQIGEAEAKAINVKLVVEGANGPTSPQGEKILLDRGIDIIPDVLANSGGVTVSYYEWVQNKRSESWTEEEVDARLEKAMKRAYREVADFARTKKVDRRIAAYGLALQRIEAVYKEREIFP
jgi:glutamate dehydrogenase (NAD(P)+)